MEGSQEVEVKQTNTDYLLPAFMIIGEQKCGTSALYRYLIAHPHILPCLTKEPQLFHKSAAEIQEGWDSYRRLFPLKHDPNPIQIQWPELDQHGKIFEESLHFIRIPGRKYISGEASANTFREARPEIVKKYLPNIRLILLLRNPIDRAFSLYRMHQRFWKEGRNIEQPPPDFETAIQQEINGLPGPYLQSGIYVEKLIQWQSVFGSQMKVIFSEELQMKTERSRIMTELIEFLDIPFYQYDSFLNQTFNQAQPAQMNPSTREKLQAFFQPHTIRLAQKLNCQIPWK